MSHKEMEKELRRLETMTMITISNLPRDLVEEIVHRVPLTHMREVRLTCKKWNALFQTQSFTKINISREAKELGESRKIVMMDYNLHLMNIVVNENPSIEAKGKLIFLNDSEQVKISQVFHCQGLLLLCLLRNEKCKWRRDDNTKVVVWNPYLGQTRWIKTSNNYSFRTLYVYDSYHYALGYENKSGNRNSKILRFIDDFIIHPEKPAFLFEIYDFESHLWKTLDVVSPQWRITSDRGVSLKGNTYWGAIERKTLSPIDHIICFDFTSERFGPFLPLPFSAYTQFACLKDEKLVALFQSRETDKMEIWITTKVEVTQVSWSNFFTMNMPLCLDHLLSHKSYLVDEEKKVVMVFDKQGTTVCDLTHGRVDFIFAGESRSFSKLEHDDEMCWPIESLPYEYWPIVCSYVPSSVQIKLGKEDQEEAKRGDDLWSRFKF